MKSILPKSLAVICLLAMARCAGPQPKKVVINPLAERVKALEMDLKDQIKEISRLNSIVNQMKKKNGEGHEPAKMRAFISPSDSELAAPVQPKSAKLPVIKIKPENRETAEERVSPLMDEVETIADSSQDSMHSYYRGLQLYNDKHYEDSIESFRVFVSENPNHVYADRAQFLIADSYFKNKDYGMVVVATNLLETKYPYSLKLPEATYRRGMAFVEMNQLVQAKSTLSQLIKNFPKEPIADLARKKWAELSKDSSTKIQ